MKNLNIVEEYVLCILDEEIKPQLLVKEATKGKINSNYNYEVCIIASEIFELIFLDVLSVDEKNKLFIQNEYKGTDKSFEDIYNKVKNSKKPHTIDKYIEEFCFGFSRKELTNNINNIINSLIEKGVVTENEKKGLLGSRIVYNTNKEVVNKIVEKVRAEFLEDVELSDETLILGALLWKSGVLDNIFSKIERNRMKERIKEVKETKFAKIITSVIENYEAMLVVIMSSI